MDKNTTDSMTTVQMKEYAASEIYSTASEAPPAYPMREASSVKIAKIIALTVILSSVIIGSFMLGSVYLQARASCDQMQALDSMLEKELMLETLQQVNELPKAEALLQTADDSADDDDEKAINANSLGGGSKKSDSDTSYSDNDESADLNRVNVKMPLELNLSELAHTIMQNNQKSRMNCVIERRQAEEIIDDGEPKKRVTGERMAIFCESGTETKAPETQEAEQIPAVMMRPISYGPVPQHFPLTHMPMQMEPRQPQMPQQQPQSTVIHRLIPQQFIVRQIHLQPQSQPQQQMPQQQQQQAGGPPAFHMAGPQPHAPHLVALRFNMQPPPSVHQQMAQPEQMMAAPRPMMPMPMPEDRPIPYQIRNELLELQKQREMQQQQPPPQPQQQEQPQQGVQMQRVPLSLALQRVGITPDDLRNIQRMAEDRIQQEVQQLNSEFNHMHEAAAAAAGNGPRGSSSSSSSSYSADSSSSSDPDSSDESSSENGSDEDAQILQIGRSAFGRSVVTPIRIPVNLMQAIAQAESNDKAPAGDVEHRSMISENRPNNAEDEQ